MSPPSIIDLLLVFRASSSCLDFFSFLLSLCVHLHLLVFEFGSSLKINEEFSRNNEDQFMTRAVHWIINPPFDETPIF